MFYKQKQYSNSWDHSRNHNTTATPLQPCISEQQRRDSEVHTHQVRGFQYKSPPYCKHPWALRGDCYMCVCVGRGGGGAGIPLQNFKCFLILSSPLVVTFQHFWGPRSNLRACRSQNIPGRAYPHAPPPPPPPRGERGSTCIIFPMPTEIWRSSRGFPL